MRAERLGITGKQLLRPSERAAEGAVYAFKAVVRRGSGLMVAVYRHRWPHFATLDGHAEAACCLKLFDINAIEICEGMERQVQ